MGRDGWSAGCSGGRRFQSTLPAWGETACPSPCARSLSYFNPLSPHGERQKSEKQFQSAWVNFNPLSPHGERPSCFTMYSRPMPISIHSPRMGRDYTREKAQSGPKIISIHSPRMGRDGGRQRSTNFSRDFNPLSPHGERPDGCLEDEDYMRFQSTLPAWGETKNASLSCTSMPFQSTLPAWGETAQV